MAYKRLVPPARQLCQGFKYAGHHHRQTPSRCVAPSVTATARRNYADVQLHLTPSEGSLIEHGVPVSPSRTLEGQTPAVQTSFQPQRNPFVTTAQCTLHSFPSFSPTGFASYPSTHLSVPLRKDILHRAVIYEGDMTRQGTASTKWRSEVHGSNRKIRPQKGTGRARLGDKKSPMLRGGGVAFGPKPRDFSTDLPAKIYHLAWRTALSYRYRKGELIVVDGPAELSIPEAAQERYMRELMQQNKMGHADGRTLFVTLQKREGLFTALRAGRMDREGRALDVEDVDVKDLLELGRLVVEKAALDWMLERHEDDLVPDQRLRKWADGQGLTLDVPHAAEEHFAKKLLRAEV